MNTPYPFIHEDGQGGAVWESMDLDENSEVKGLITMTQFLHNIGGEDEVEASSSAELSDRTPTSRRGPQGPYLKHGDERIEELIRLVNNCCLSITKAASQVGTPRSTAQRKVAQFEDDEKKRLPGRTPYALKPGTKAKLKEDHTLCRTSIDTP
ncbi:hypothetical protein EDD21DRAFT_415837 [Dissophora ornata]|nr:hypothetical protein EDD21DRAFT_415837 [Dissophora ornata]